MAKTATSDTGGFLPEDYVQPKSNSDYMKFELGENKFRILSKPIIGWSDWSKDKKPLRFPVKKKPSSPVDPSSPIKFFWAMIVWNYNENKIQILEITQIGIQSSIEALAKDPDWGTPNLYDIKVTKKGKSKQTEYSVTPSPKKDISADILKAFKDKPIYLNALYEENDPFTPTKEITPLIK